MRSLFYLSEGKISCNDNPVISWPQVTSRAGVGFPQNRVRVVASRLAGIRVAQDPGPQAGELFATAETLQTPISPFKMACSPCGVCINCY